MKRSKQTTSPSETDGTPGRRNRRQVLALGGAAAAVAAVAALGTDRGKKAHAATGDDMKVGESHVASAGDSTSLTGNVPGFDAVLTISNLSSNRGDGLAVIARGGFSAPWSEWGAGPSAAILAIAQNSDGTAYGAGHGLMGTSGLGAGVIGTAMGGVGGPPGAVGIGVIGWSQGGGPGVLAVAPGDAPAVKARSGPIIPFGVSDPDGGLALEVDGQVQFATAGRATVPAGATSSAPISMPFINSANSVVLLNPQGEPGGRSFWPEWADGSFTVRVSRRMRLALEFGYLVINSPPPVPPEPPAP